MKPPLLLLVALLSFASTAAQHPLVGTWEMISARGIGADGERFYLDSSTVKETKIITPTHYMLIAWDVEGDSIIFNRTMAGQVRIEGNRYIEVPTQASVQIFDNVKVDFTWKLEGDIFTQAGTIVRPDGKTVVLEALVFKRLPDVKPQHQNPAIGAWTHRSAHYTTANSNEQPVPAPGARRFLLITPTHLMRMDHNNEKFESVSYGTYLYKQDSVVSTLLYASFPHKSGEMHRFRQRVDGGKVELISTGLSPRGEPATFYDILEKLD